MMKANVCKNPLSLPRFPNPRFSGANSSSNVPLAAFPFFKMLPLRVRTFHHSSTLLPNPVCKVIKQGLDLTDQVCGGEHGDLIWETCITRTLPPALSLEQGLHNLMEAIDLMKLNPPLSRSGILRFQVAVPPAVRAMNWFCCLPSSSEAFPLFFLSKEMRNPACKSFYFSESRGVFGFGIAASFTCSSYSSIDWSLLDFKRYFAVDSGLIKPYGVLNIDIGTVLSSFKHKMGSWFFIPQIELDELEHVSILAFTLAWSDSLYCTFTDAIHSFESSIEQATGHVWPIPEKCSNNCRQSTLNNFSTIEDENVHMIYMNFLPPAERKADLTELNGAIVSRRFCIRLSPTFSVCNNMPSAGNFIFLERPHANINSVWASLIVEECSRLGLMYFCIAPGSRSSPLAIAASLHPLTTCIACYDERSLAFHAVGYARGSNKPAVVITSSGTAVSNLLPAVVEASQDFLPLLLLTADRPPELHNAGANQAIKQVDHFGSFVRLFFNLPTPTDHIPARVVLTTLDSAMHWVTSSPPGPVHVNCPFREPLEDSPRDWTLGCLEGLDPWMSSNEPFTKYIQLQYPNALNDNGSQMREVLQAIEGADKGLLVFGAIHTEDEMWAALLIAKHLLWPVVADILSGLRFRKLLTSLHEIKDSIIFVDHFDHALLSDLVKEQMQPDVVIQIGSRITSKRVSQFLEKCFQRSYILVDKHPARHDASHIVTHRIQSTIAQFANCLLKNQFSPLSKKWTGLLLAVELMVASEISFQIHSEESLTEPHVAHVLSEALCMESALFLGNSMAIRDVDMYGCCWADCAHDSAAILSFGLQCHGILVSGNRGASGIDGLLSSAIGFAVGCNKRVLCVIGDVSFLHDTNGLAILKERMQRKPMTIVVINNHGGAIFSFLPIADRTSRRILDQYFYTTHNISIGKLCHAHGVKHVQVHTRMELQDILLSSQQDENDCVIEVESCIDSNATFHSMLRNSACQAADHAVSLHSSLFTLDSLGQGFLGDIYRVEYSNYRILLASAPTSASVSHDTSVFYREGFILALSLGDGNIGYGEVAPLEFHKENLLDVEEQLRFLLHALPGAKIGHVLPLLRGAFSSWIWTELGVAPCSLYPSVRCGLEMAILNAIAARQGLSLLNVLRPQINQEQELYERFSQVQICALIDANGTPGEVAFVAAKLVKEGFTALKLKVGRRTNPILDAAVIKEVRKLVGNKIQLRADANRKWTYEKAIEFGNHVKSCCLQYIEEPVRNEDDIINFCEETGLPVALDETIDNITVDPLRKLVKFRHKGVVAIVIKPSYVGGFENAVLIARWAQKEGKIAVVSSAFESGLGLSAYIQLSCYFELQNAEICRVMKRELAPPLAHGLGTYKWLKEDVTMQPLRVCSNPNSGLVEASVGHADEILRRSKINHNAIYRRFFGEQVRTYTLNVKVEGFSYIIKVIEVGPSTNDNVVLFLHGFLGTGEDWIPIMKALSGSARCISVDLPGHGGTEAQAGARKKAADEPSLSMEVVSRALCELLHCISPGKVILIGYSMGARITLCMALRFRLRIEGAVLISGSPGLKELEARISRKARDDCKARILISQGLESFLDSWYAGDQWKSLRSHPHFDRIVTSRMQHVDVHNLAKVLSGLSIGKELSMWEELKQLRIPVLLIVGESDPKFKRIAVEMCREIADGAKSRDIPAEELCEMVEVPNCGHAAHLENPLHVIGAVGRFLARLGWKSTLN